VKAASKLTQMDFVLNVEMDFMKQIISVTHVIVVVQLAQILQIVLLVQTVIIGVLPTEDYVFLVLMVVRLVIIQTFATLV
jgi:hypothetical protein